MAFVHHFNKGDNFYVVLFASFLKRGLLKKGGICSHASSSVFANSSSFKTQEQNVSVDPDETTHLATYWSIWNAVRERQTV